MPRTLTCFSSLLARARFTAGIRELLVASSFAIGCGEEAASEEEPPGEFRDGGGAQCEVVEDLDALRTDFVERLYPDSADDVPIFCVFEPGSNVCAPEGSHLSGVIPFVGAVPTEAACRASAGATLAKCDRYAKHLVTSALDTGDLAKLLRGVTRMRDVMARPTVPSYYSLGSPANRFAQWLAAAEIDAADLGACTTGTDRALYECLATAANAPSKRNVRGLLERLDHHNGVLVRAGMVAGASERQAKVFASATGPLNARLAKDGMFAPRGNARVQRVQALAKVFALRVLDGSAVSDPETELAAFLELPGFTPPVGPSELYTASTGLLAAQTAAYGWNARTGSPRTFDMRGAADLREFFAILRATGITASGAGHCDVGEELASMYVRTAASSIFGGLFDRSDVLSDLDLHIPAATLLDLWDAANHDYVESCHMHQELVAMTTLWNETIAVPEEMWVGDTFTGHSCEEDVQWIDSEGNTGNINDCWCTNYSVDVHPDGTVTQDECIEWTIQVLFDSHSQGWQDYGVGIGASTTIDEYFAVMITKEKVHEAYNDLLSSDNDGDGDMEVGEKYDRSGDNSPDLHHSEDDAANMTILRTSVGWNECQAEIEALSGNYATGTFDSLTCGADGPSGDCTSDDLESYQFIPYAIAVHACPEYTALVTGVLDTDAAGDSCATPWRFTQAVQYFLEHDYIPAEAIEDFPEYGSMRKPLLIDFAAEAIALSQPVAAMYRQRADFASVAGDLPTGVGQVGADDWYDGYSGLDVVDARLATGETVMAAGIDLFLDFERLDVWGESGRSIIARLSAEALAECEAGQCDDNDRIHARALLYRRLRDGIETYRQLGSGRIETQWRRLDGMLCFDVNNSNGYDHCDSCIVGVDTAPADGIIDTYGCDPTLDLDLDGDHDDCAEQCAYFGTVASTSELGGARLGELAEVLDAHSGRDVLDPQQQDFLASAASFARGTAVQFARDLDSALEGRDWLGYKQGLWYPGVSIEENNGVVEVPDKIALAKVDLKTSIQDANYEGFIDTYLERVTNLENWAGQVGQSHADLAAQAQDYCTGGALDACSTEWRTDYDQIGAINDRLESVLCDRQVAIWHYDESGGVTQSVDPLGPTGGDCFEDIVSPDFEVLSDHGGALPLKAEQLALALTRLQVAVDDMDSYIDLIQANNAARKELGQVLDDVHEHERRTERRQDAVNCGFAIGGAVVISIVGAVCTVFSEGACAPAAAMGIASAWTGAASTCAAVGAAGNSFNDAPTEAEVQSAYNEYSMTLQADEEAYTLALKMGVITTLLAEYRVQVREFLDLESEQQRRMAFGNLVLDELVDDDLFDPSLQLFDEESLGAMTDAFRGLAQQVRDFHHLIEYDIGQRVREEGTFQVEEGADGYFLPKLSQLTIYKSVGYSFDNSFQTLQTSSGEAGVASERGFNLVAYASLLARVHFVFSDVYQDRVPSATPVYIGGPSSGLPGVDMDGDLDLDDADALLSDNPGDRAMLGDSPFYDPWRNPDDAGGCAAGFVDISDYCPKYWGTNTVVQPNTCVDIRNLTSIQRYSLGYLTHMTHGVGARLFACGPMVTVCTAYDEDAWCIEETTYGPSIDVAPDGDGDGVFSLAELGTVPANGIYTPAFYNAQTPTVRRIIDKFVEENALHADALDLGDLHADPGTYLWLVNMTAGGEENGHSAASFDPEEDLTFGETIVEDSIAEHLTGMALVCTDEVSCPDEDNDFAFDLLMFGPAYLGDRCLSRDTNRQERVAFSMEPEAILTLPALVSTSAANLNEDVQPVLTDPVEQDRMGAQPLHGSSWLISMRGHTDASGDALEPGWALYADDTFSNEGPRVRVALRYSYYEATEQTGDFEYDVAGLLECNNASDATLCVNGSCP